MTIEHCAADECGGHIDETPVTFYRGAPPELFANILPGSLVPVHSLDGVVIVRRFHAVPLWSE